MGAQPAQATRPSISGLPWIGPLTATVVLALVARRAADPVRTFRRIAVVALVASWIPDIVLLVGPSPGYPVSPAGVAALMTLHATAALIIVTLLTTLATRPRG